MVVTELYEGQGLGNQIWCYVVTRVITKDKGYDFGIMHPENFKGLDFMDLDFGRPIIGGNGPEGERPFSLPEGVKYYYSEHKIVHPVSMADIRIYDKNLINVPDDTKIDGVMQDEQYILHRKNEIRGWLKIKNEYDCFDYSSEDICIINFRGGEFSRHKELYLTQKYWNDAVAQMQQIKKGLKFIVITDDIVNAKKFFPQYEVLHFNIGKDYSIIKNAYYLILSNSSFAWFPAWLSDNLKYCIAPKYWGRHNISDGYWSCGYNITSGWHYLDRDGKIFNYDSCVKEFTNYIEKHKDLFKTEESLNRYIFKPSNKFTFLKQRGVFYIRKIKEVISRFL
ncbi:MAG: glycosyl transferase [Candidatus Paceibacterota bacterium]